MYNGQYSQLYGYNPQLYGYNTYNQQSTIENIDEQISRLQKLKTQVQQPNQPTSINQTFQLAPTNNNVMKYANSMDDVQREMTIGDTPFFSKDMSVVWIKNAKGDIKTYELNEIIAKDEKDIQIALLQSQVDELRKEMKNNEWSNANVIESETSTNTTRNDESTRTTTQKSESTSIQRIPTSKKGK